MTVQTRNGRNVYTWIAFACVVALLLTGGLWWVFRQSAGSTLSAYFGRTVGLYAGSSVRVLGVPVGEITAVTPQGGKVRVDMRVGGDVDIPEGAGAVVIAPSLVSDRYVQLTPAYSGGEVMRSGTVIPTERTATPVEVDELYGSLNEVAKSLGPTGANANGALSDVLDAAAANLDGNGKNLNTTVRKLAELSRTFQSSKGDLFATISNLRKFTGMLAGSDRQVNEFYQRMADVSGFLAEDADEVGAALASLAGALGDVKTFVEENSDALSSNIDKLSSVTGVLVKQRSALAEVMDVAPVGMNNFLNAYDAASGTTAIRYNANELTHPPLTLLCRFASALTPTQLPDVVGKTCDTLKPALEGLPELPSASQALSSLQQGELPPLPLPGVNALTQRILGGK